MKKNQIYKYLVFSFFWSLLSLCLTVYSQENAKTNKPENVTVRSVIVDEGGKPLQNVVITDAKETIIAYTANDGKFEINAKNNSSLFIETLGYERKIISIQDNSIPESITLKKIPFYQGEKDDILFPAGISETKRNTIGAVGVIKGETLHSYPDILLSNMLQGKLSGLNVSMNAGGLASNPSSLSVRGNQRGGSNPIITIVDGMERPIDNLLPEEIESIEILKDATAKIMYGARAANGVLLITTKKGEKLKQIIKIGVEYGYGQVTRTPEYLDAYEYALLYNQARQRDNLVPLYSSADIEGYQNSTGTNDFRYPNVDFNDYFLENSNNYHKLSLVFSGGDERTQYALITGYSGTDGLEKIGTKPEYNRLNMRGNLNVKINDLISGFIGLALQYDRTIRSNLSHNSVYQAISNTRPNEYPLIIDEGIIKSDTTGLPALGASFTNPDNLYGALQYGGYSRNQNLNGQTNFGLDFNLNKYLQGLSAKAYLSFDNSFFGIESLSTSAATYAQRFIKKADGTDSLLLTQLKKTNLTDDVRLSNTFNQRTSGWFANVNYNYEFEKHALKFDLSNIRLKQEFTGSSQDIKSVNYILRGNYVYGNKYIVEGDLSYMGSSKFTGDNKYQLFYAGGLGWILSEEEFFKTLAQEQINYFKIKTSLGLLGYDASTTYHLSQNRWLNNGTFQFNNGNSTSKIRLDVVGNPGLRWEKSRQFNLGIEILAFNRKLATEINYFNELSFDQIEKADAIYSSLYGSLFPYTNLGKVANQGVEIELRWTETTNGGLRYSIGGNMLYSKNKVLKANQINYPDDYRSMIDKPSDSMFGYVTEGIFGKDVQLDDHPLQTFGPYGNGDIAYKDLNNDGVINTLDRKKIGNAFPRFILGLDFNFSYKNWGLYLLGTANLGVKSWLNNSYYWMRGENKYSIMAFESYHPESNPNGKYPALTTTPGANNYMNSDMWIENSSFFRLKNMEISYTIQNKHVESFIKSTKIFCRGSNLFVLSKIKDLDPEALNAGILNYPVMRTLTAGVNITF